MLFRSATIFENMGFTYLGPADGHDLPNLISLLSAAKELREPVVVHVVTKKGKGYPFAEEDPAKFHGIGKFDPMTGKKLGVKAATYSDSFGETMIALAENNQKVCAITAAMPGGTGLLSFQKRFPDRTFDVGIAEEHAVSMAGGLAKQGMVPVVALYATFLQRSFDQIIQDICLLHLHVVLAIDRAGLVGDDGPTHHGVFDIGFLRQMPGMRILNPASLAEQKDMLRWAVEDYDGPVAVRYPRGTEGSYTACDWQGLDGALVKCHRNGRDVALITYGSTLQTALDAAEELAKQGIEAAVLRLLSVCPVPSEQVAAFLQQTKLAVIIEETASNSGIREALAWDLARLCPNCRVDGIDLGQDFVPHGTLKELYERCGLDAVSISEFTREVLAR